MDQFQSLDKVSAVYSSNTDVNDISKAFLNPGAERAERPRTFSKREAGYCFTGMPS